jgi:pimeloyl-ACP methyl ester carboxylesterase
MALVIGRGILFGAVAFWTTFGTHKSGLGMYIRWRLLLGTLGLALIITPALHAQRGIRSAPPQAVKLQTKDGVELAITYYASTVGKDATPVVLLHDYKDTQGVFSSLAQRLQSPGTDDKHTSFAVVTVDLRGHGASTKQAAPDGSTREIDAAKLGKDDVLAMSGIDGDMEAVRSFLVGKNDKEELNLNRLCLVGLGMGATVAVNWAAQDWVAPSLTVGKQGQDVKALVLVSPRWKDHGITIQDALKLASFKQSIAWMLVCGDTDTTSKGGAGAANRSDAGAVADAQRIFKQLERFHPQPAPGKAAKVSDLVTISQPSALQGGKLFAQLGPKLEDQIIEFLTVNVSQKDWPWVKRRNTVPQ